MFSTWTLALQSCTRLQLSKIKTVTNVLLLPVTDVASIVSTDVLELSSYCDFIVRSLIHTHAGFTTYIQDAPM